ncbi:MAG TPA: NifU family protein [Candidatus Pelethenecus sp.]|jgi:Thioredoxin-like proteins and domains|nr:NifU family protein [Candidatus Pelethenecus sp.]
METNRIEEQIKKILGKIRPYLNSEGGDLEYLGFKDGIVYVRMLGACIDCGALDSTLKDGIEALLVENVPEVIEVKNLAVGEDVNDIFSE